MARRNKTTCPSAYDAALSYLSPKARTVREVELKLDEGSYSEGEIMQTVDRLKEAGLLDDEKYARDFIDSRLSSKPVSRFRLREQLRAHHVPEEIIREALDEVEPGTEFENAVAVVKKFARQFEGMEDEEKKRRLIYTRLQTRGFSHDTIMAAMNEADE